MLLAAIATAPFTTTPELPAATTVSVLVVTVLSASGGARGGQQNQRLADVTSVAEAARRIDASLARRPAAPLEEFVTAVLAEIDPAEGRLTIYNCGHPPPLVISPDPGGEGGSGGSRLPRVTTGDVPAPALPLRLMALGGTSGAERTVPLHPGDALLLYTDGVTEARDAHREFYPLEKRVAALAATTGPGDLLDRLRDDLLRHVGAPLDDDAALLMV